MLGAWRRPRLMVSSPLSDGALPESFGWVRLSETEPSQLGKPSTPQVTPDPMLQQLMKTAQQQQVQALQVEAQGDTASLLARYGARMAAGGAPGAAPIGMMTGGR